MNKENQSKTNKLSRTAQIVILIALVGIGIASRYLLVEWPNFKPIGAIAIFCGYLMYNRWPVLIAIGAMMLISDAVLGFYEWPLMLSVYASIAAAWALGIQSRKFIDRSAIGFKIGGITGAALTASLTFFLLTNTAVWAIGWYPPTFSGFLAALAAGVPFLKFTLAGNLCFSMLLFSTCFFLKSLRWLPTPSLRTVNFGQLLFCRSGLLLSPESIVVTDQIMNGDRSDSSEATSVVGQQFIESSLDEIERIII